MGIVGGNIKSKIYGTFHYGLLCSKYNAYPAGRFFVFEINCLNRTVFNELRIIYTLYSLREIGPKFSEQADVPKY